MLGPMGRATGRDNIRELMGKILNGRAAARITSSAVPTVTLDGDEATSEVMWTVIQRDAEGKPRLTSMGRHVDRLVRETASGRSRSGAVSSIFPSSCRSL